MNYCKIGSAVIEAQNIKKLTSSIFKLLAVQKMFFQLNRMAFTEKRQTFSRKPAFIRFF